MTDDIAADIPLARSDEEVAELRHSLTAGRCLFFAISHRKKNWPVKIEGLDDGGITIMVGAGFVSTDADPNVAKQIEHVLRHGAFISRERWSEWVAAFSKGHQSYQRARRLEETAPRHGYGNAWDEHQHKTGRKKRKAPTEAVTEAAAAIRRPRKR